MLSTCERGLSKRRTNHEPPNVSDFKFMMAFMSHIISSIQGTNGYFLAKTDLLLCVILTVTHYFHTSKP